MKKVLILLLSASLAVSCNSDDDSPSGNGGTSSPMTASIDGVSLAMEPEEGGSESDPSGGIFGSDYHLLEGYKLQSGFALSAKVPVVEKEYLIHLALPKIDLSVGTHNFSNTQLPNGYFADLDMVVDGEAGEDEETISGKVIVNSYDTATGRIKGTFDFKTNNGVTATETHIVSGSFNYILTE